MTLLQRLRIFSLQCGEGGSTRKIVDEAIKHIQELELAATADHKALAEIDKINQQVCAQRDEGWTELHEAIADIAYIAGRHSYHGGDSREDVSQFIEWAKEFTDRHKETDWEKAEHGYIELIWMFMCEKIGDLDVPESKVCKKTAPILRAAKAIAKMKHPGIPHLLSKRGYNYEAGKVQELIDAVEGNPATAPPDDSVVLVLSPTFPPEPAMTADQVKLLGYEVIKASVFEVGLIKHGKGIRTWFANDFGCVMPMLDHPKILEAIRINEEPLPPTPPPSPSSSTSGAE